jgi:ribosomal protein S18 acetylase RimI-like enzyme
MKTINFTISTATESDADGVYNVRKNTWIATYPSEEFEITREDIISLFTEEKKAAEIARYKDIYAKIESGEVTDRHVWVAKVDENVVGFAMFKKEESNNRLKAIYILPEFQGYGIGKALFQSGLEWLKSKLPLLVNVAKYNLNAISYYEKMGFEYVKEIENDPAGQLPNGKVIPEIEMIRK